MHSTTPASVSPVPGSVPGAHDAPAVEQDASLSTDVWVPSPHGAHVRSDVAVGGTEAYEEGAPHTVHGLQAEALARTENVPDGHPEQVRDTPLLSSATYVPGGQSATAPASTDPVSFPVGLGLGSFEAAASPPASSAAMASAIPPSLHPASSKRSMQIATMPRAPRDGPSPTPRMSPMHQEERRSVHGT